jgi:hypothetical protein
MMITMGQLVSELFDTYDREFHDEKLAAIATQVRITELLERTACAQAQRTARRQRPGQK